MHMFLNQRPFTYRNSFTSVVKLFGLILLLASLLAACGGGSTGGNGASNPTAKGKVSVLYAGSLVNLMEKKVGPVFQQASGYGYEGEGKGSTALANEIKGKLRTPDIFI